MFEKLVLKDFTVFHALDIDIKPGINLLIGANGTGKTHILKLLYAVHSAIVEKRPLSDKIIKVFLPSDYDIGRLVRRQSYKASFTLTWKDQEITGHFGNFEKYSTHMSQNWQKIGTPVYIPVKEMLANAPGFRSLYSHRNVHFEEVYHDIVDKAFMPMLRKPVDKHYQQLLDRLSNAIDGKIMSKNEQFFLKNRSGEIELTLIAEGVRKLALLWLLIQNGSLLQGSTLYWDEPEANLNPFMLPLLVNVLMQLERLGVQLLIATHSYALLKEFDLQRQPPNDLQFISLYRDEKDHEIKANAVDNYNSLMPNPIAEEYLRLYDMEVERALRN